MSLACQQFYGMFVKKFIHARRNLAVAAAQLLLPVIFTILALSVEKAIPKNGDEPSLALNLNAFSDYKVAYTNGSSADATTTSMANYYQGQFSGARQYVAPATYPDIDDYYKAVQDDIGIATFDR